MESDFKYGTDGLSYEEHVRRYGKKNDPDHDARVAGELPRLDRATRKPKSSKRGRPVSKINHGTNYAYSVRKCRCEECTEANRITMNKRKVTEGMHGILSWAIHNDCSCKLCKTVIEKMNTENEKREKERKNR